MVSRGRNRFVAVAAALVACLIAALAAEAGATRQRGAAASPTPGADCQPFGATPCLLPFPNDLFTSPDRSTPTGRRVHLPVNAMPVNVAGKRISAREYDRSDGFSPGSDVIVRVPGLDTAAALQRTGAVSLADEARSYDKRQPIVVIDERTLHRQLIWSELDANAGSPASTDLLIHPGKNFAEGHTFVVALRNLRDANGHVIKAPAWFERLRDKRPLPRVERPQKARYARIFAALKQAGIPRKHLYEAWDFTVASSQSLTARMLAIRNAAFARLGDHNLADGRPVGHAPSFTITSTDNLTPQIRRVQGTFTVPCFLITCGASATSGFHYRSRRPDALPTQISGNTATAPFECIVPVQAGLPTPARVSLYGHGLLGSHDEVEAGNVRAMASEHDFVFCATDWWGLAQGDVPYDIQALLDLNKFPTVVDRLQQGVLNTLYLGRLLIANHGLASNPAFQIAGRPLIDTSHLYYDGNSQGGIMGGMTTAVAPDFRRAVLGVTGMDYGGILLQRSTDFGSYQPILYTSYPDASMHPVILDLMQQLWDRGEADGYAEQMTTHPLPDTPSHTVLMQVGYGDFQVSMYAAAVQARTIGAAAHEPALDPARARDRNLYFAIPAIRRYPFKGSAIVIWDSGPGRVPPPPLANLPPQQGSDPHGDVRATQAARLQKSDFLQPNGAVIDVCAGQPCHTDVYAP